MPTCDLLDHQSAAEVLSMLYARKAVIEVGIPGVFTQDVTLEEMAPQAGAPAFTISPSQALRHLVQEKGGGSACFQFTAGDQRHYVFDARLLKEDGTRMHFALPERMQRFRHRGHYRFSPPARSELHVDLNENSVTMTIENAGTGGVLCLCSRRFIEAVQSNPVRLNSSGGRADR